jgi:hypothetical protein
MRYQEFARAASYQLVGRLGHVHCDLLNRLLQLGYLRIAHASRSLKRVPVAEGGGIGAKHPREP